MEQMPNTKTKRRNPLLLRAELAALEAEAEATLRKNPSKSCGCNEQTCTWPARFLCSGKLVSELASQPMVMERADFKLPSFRIT